MDLCMIDAEDVRRYVRQYDALLVDLRSEEDYQNYHITGAIHIPPEQLPCFMRQTDKQRLHIFYCQHGSLNIREGRKYLRQGYRICSLAGGMDAYLFHRKTML
ncbi:MAG: rhodanese-like domain-containing protein [Clostridiales bacterium]|nr:rhodanese-like domain-containing protein [Clostridiales bacterium]